MAQPWEDLRALVVAAEPGSVSLQDERLHTLAEQGDALDRARRAVDEFWELLATDPRTALAESLLAHAVAEQRAAGLRPALALRHATALLVLGCPERAVEVLEAELARHPRGGPGPDRTRLLALLGKVLLPLGELQRALVVLEEALALTRAQDAGAAEGGVLSALGNARLLAGDLESAGDYYGQALRLAERHGSDEGIAVGLGNRGLVRHLAGDEEGAAADYEAALQRARAAGDRRCALPVLANLGLLAYEQGDLEEATRRLDAALELGGALGDRSARATCLVRLAAVARERDASREVARLLDAAEVSLESQGQGPPGASRVSWWLERARLALREGDLPVARELCRRARARAAELQNVGGVAAATLEAGRVALREGLLEPGLKLLDEALAQARELAQPLLHGWAQVERARALLQLGRVPEAEASLLDARRRLPRGSIAAARLELVRARALPPEDAAPLRAALRAQAAARGWGALAHELAGE
ncbi:MAG: hypothetical protein AB7N76_25190 [Planctomycetota bacterium]